ncbi:hypothetical protein BJ508DRAFT_335412 [Ascobolus immersus RN42]|uniref:Uncharacterized protein n=1 Tax=Ascobolus immersus RN42 TaxID=1160509 RepID=A0A3N4HQY0_ASCIM|nr:hypothetical protein BJ508DRAFT_335412 [Ascobolus immersus RN42]
MDRPVTQSNHSELNSTSSWMASSTSGPDLQSGPRGDNEDQLQHGHFNGLSTSRTSNRLPLGTIGFGNRLKRLREEAERGLSPREAEPDTDTGSSTATFAKSAPQSQTPEVSTIYRTGGSTITITYNRPGYENGKIIAIEGHGQSMTLFCPQKESVTVQWDPKAFEALDEPGKNLISHLLANVNGTGCTRREAGTQTHTDMAEKNNDLGSGREDVNPTLNMNNNNERSQDLYELARQDRCPESRYGSSSPVHHFDDTVGTQTLVGFDPCEEGSKGPKGQIGSCETLVTSPSQVGDHSHRHKRVRFQLGGREADTDRQSDPYLSILNGDYARFETGTLGSISRQVVNGFGPGVIIGGNSNPSNSQRSDWTFAWAAVDEGDSGDEESEKGEEEKEEDSQATQSQTASQARLPKLQPLIGLCKRFRNHEGVVLVKFEAHRRVSRSQPNPVRPTAGLDVSLHVRPDDNMSNHTVDNPFHLGIVVMDLTKEGNIPKQYGWVVLENCGNRESIAKIKSLKCFGNHTIIGRILPTRFQDFVREKEAHGIEGLKAWSSDDLDGPYKYDYSIFLVHWIAVCPKGLSLNTAVSREMGFCD